MANVKRLSYVARPLQFRCLTCAVADSSPLTPAASPMGLTPCHGSVHARRVLVQLTLLHLNKVHSTQIDYQFINSYIIKCYITK